MTPTRLYSPKRTDGGFSEASRHGTAIPVLFEGLLCKDKEEIVLLLDTVSYPPNSHKDSPHQVEQDHLSQI